MDNEIWKDVVNYEGTYMISNLGRIKSLSRMVMYPDGHLQQCKGKMMRPYISTWGYLSVRLSKNGKQVHRHIHDLVAEAFIPNPNHLSEVNHKDLDKTNNRVDNLEWCTHKENMVHMFNHYGAVPHHKFHQRQHINIHKYCCDCGCEIAIGSTRCNRCRGQLQVTIPPISREQLKNAIRTKSFLSIGKDFSVTDNAIRKWCKKYQLPYKTSDIKQISDEAWQLI